MTFSVRSSDLPGDKCSLEILLCEREREQQQPPSSKKNLLLLFLGEEKITVDLSPLPLSMAQ